MSETSQRGASRRDWFKAGVAGLAGLATFTPASAQTSAPAAESVIGMKFDPKPEIRLGMIGLGGRGGGMVRNYLAVDNLRITAVCDIDHPKALAAQAAVERAGQHPPAVYGKNERDFENLVRRDDVDFVYIAAPWDWHVPMAVEAMKQGKHACIEVPAATTIEDCWKLVDTSEQTRRHCLMMENCCYGYTELLVLNLVRAGLFGELLHAEGGYLHDLREILFEDRSEGLWRRFPHTKRNGNLYPTHGLGPIANYFGINRGDRFDYMVSISSPQRGLDAWREQHVPRDSPKWRERYICGDINTSLIKTVNGRTITLGHEVVNPRPYSRVNALHGEKGLFRDYPPRIYFDNQPGGEKYSDIDQYKAGYEHPLWKHQGELARKLGGHGGMDFLMVYRLIECMREGLAPDLDVYDAAAWSAPGPLSEMSVAQGSAPVKFPDFTRGRWQEKRGWLVNS
jgi:hypothetical protein